jgi:hypothetical protein
MAGTVAARVSHGEGGSCGLWITGGASPLSWVAPPVAQCQG